MTYQKMESKAHQMATRSLGQAMRVRIQKNLCVSGTIVSCQPEIITQPTGKFALFHVVLEYGAAKIRHSVQVTQIPCR